MTTRLSLRLRFTNRHLRSAGRVAATTLLCSMVIGVQGASAATTHWVNDDELSPTPPGTGCGDAGYTNIQAAVTAAMSGDTIMVCSGTYIENINLAKSLTLLGARAGENACGRMPVNDSIVTPLLPAVMTVELDTGSAGSIINGFTFRGGTRAIVSDTGPIDGLQLLNNRIELFTGNGVFLDDNGLNITVSQNEIDGSAKVGGGGLFHLDIDNFDGFWFTNNCVLNGVPGTGFFVDGNRNVDGGSGARVPQFVGNFINNNGTGVNLGGRAWGDGPISGNTFSNNRFDGLQGGPRDSRISDNWFDNNGRSGLAFTSFGNAAADRGAQRNTVELNCVTRNGFTAGGEGIFLSAGQAPGTISTNEIHENNIIGNAVGLRYLGFEIIEAELNWWGSPNGPFHPTNNPSGTGNPVVDNGTVGFIPWRTTARAGTPCGVGPATTLTLDPVAATNPVDTQHCVTATVTNAFGIPQPGISVHFTVTGSVSESGADTTDANGEATFCYLGPPIPGADVITAYADTDGSNTQDPLEPTGAASKKWILPVTTPGCEITITNGGWIIAMNGDRGSFGGNAKADEDGNVSGQEEYQDHGPVEPFNLHGYVTVIVCGPDPTQATIFGQATIDGTGSHNYRIDVSDIAEPGTGVDKYRMRVNTYDSGEQTLEGGNVQIRKQD
jgi:hypothetical protein